MAPDDSPEASVAPASAAPKSGRPEGARFTLRERVRRRREYQAVYEHGARLSGSFMTVFFYRNTLGQPRLGIAATRKIGPAVGRNRAKRRVRELFRRNKIAEGVDIVVIPRRELIDAPFERIEADYRAILKRRARVARG